MWVLDASVAVKWFFLDEPLRSKALDVRSHLINNPKAFVVPSLFYSEMLHVLTKKSAQDLLFVQQALALTWKLGIRTLALSDQGFAKAACFSCSGLSGYDASYLALAQELKAQWLSADAQALKKAPNEYAIELSHWN